MDQLNIVFNMELAPSSNGLPGEASPGEASPGDASLQDRFGLVWEEDAQPEAVVAMAERMFPSLKPLSQLDVKGEEQAPTHYVIEGDNYHSLSTLCITHQARIDAIYIDPPYNTGLTSLRYTDRSEGKTKRKKHSRWLSFMYRRLLLARQLLTEDGVIFISIDDREMAHLKLLCDGIFGAKNFIGSFIWHNRTTPNDAANRFATDHEYVLLYARQRAHFQLKGVPKDFSKYVNRDDDPRGPWMPDNPSAASGTEKDRFPIKNPHTGEVYYPPDGRYWAFAKRRVKEWANSGKLVFPTTEGKKFLLKKYRSELKSDTKPASSLIQGVLTSHGTKELKQLFEGGSPIKYPKPTALVKYLLGLLDKPDGIFLDFFAGSGTVGQAVLELNRADGGSRQFILCNNNENELCREVLYPRVKKVMTGYVRSTNQTEILYQKKLSLSDLPEGAAIAEHLVALAKQHQDHYDELRRSFKDNTVTLEGIRRKPAAVDGYPDNLRYYQTLFLPPQDTRIRQACADLITFQREAYEPVQVHQNFRVYRNSETLLILCFEGKFGFPTLKKHIDQAQASVLLYVFHKEDYRLAQTKFSEAEVRYVPVKMRQLFTS